jgi:hypothetical protein
MCSEFDELNAYFCEKQMSDIQNTCFVCKKHLKDVNFEMNQMVQLPVCPECRGTEKEKQEAKSVLDSLADGFVCGCI